MATKQQTEKAEAIARLRELCPPGTVVYTTLRRVARSGMSRVIALHVVTDGDTRDLTWNAGKALGYTVKRTDCGEGLSVPCCGMDMGFHLVHSLSYALHPENERKGYTLTHQWL